MMFGGSATSDPGLPSSPLAYQCGTCQEIVSYTGTSSKLGLSQATCWMEVDVRGGFRRMESWASLNVNHSSRIGRKASAF